MLGYKQVPLSLLFSQVMAGLTSFERDVVFSAQLGQDERHCLPFDAATLRSVVFPTRPFVGLRQIADARDKLLALGVFLKKTSPRKEWLEIQAPYRHSKGNNETSFGDETPEPEQAELCLPMIVDPPKRNRLRTDSKQNKTTDSGAPMLLPPADSGNQELELDDDETPNDPLWLDLCRAAGLVEMTQWRKLWLKRYRTCRDALAVAVRDYQSLQDPAKKSYAAKYITTAFENEKARMTG